jgi:hypothetical protein
MPWGRLAVKKEVDGFAVFLWEEMRSSPFSRQLSSCPMRRAAAEDSPSTVMLRNYTNIRTSPADVA